MASSINLTSTLQVPNTPIEVSGFYAATGEKELTFYVTSDKPLVQVGSGWISSDILGLTGQINVVRAVYVRGATSHGAYNWYFIFQTDTEQNIESVQNVISATLYAPKQFNYNNKKTIYPIFGRYLIIDGQLKFYFSSPPQANIDKGWLVSGLPNIDCDLRVAAYSSGFASVIEDGFEKSNLAILEPVDGRTLVDVRTPIYVKGMPAVIREASYSTTFTPAKVTNFTSEYISNVYVEINSNVRTGNYAPQRDLGRDVEWSAAPSIGLFPESEYKETKGEGFSSGSLLALEAIGPQEKYLLADDFTKSPWNAEFKRHSNFVMYQKTYPFPPPNPNYQGQTVQIELKPTEMGHLLSNMYLSVQLPDLNGALYATNIGRSLISKVDLLVNETVVETLYDDWYTIRDQLFLDADEQYGLQKAIGTATPTITSNVAYGGITSYLNGNTIHTYTSSGVFVLNYPNTVTINIVGGGGAGSPNGEGGGGGAATSTNLYLQAGQYIVTVGSGGAQATPDGGSSSIVFYPAVGASQTVVAAAGGQGGVNGGVSGSGYSNSATYSDATGTFYASGGGAAGAGITSPGGYGLYGGSGGSAVSIIDLTTNSPSYMGGGGAGAMNADPVNFNYYNGASSPGSFFQGGWSMIYNSGSFSFDPRACGPLTHSILPGYYDTHRITTDVFGNVYFTHSGKIVKLSSSGYIIADFAPDVYNPYVIITDSDGNVYTAGWDNSRVTKLSVNGELLWSKYLLSGSALYPRDAAIYYTSGSPRVQIIYYNPAGGSYFNFILEINSDGQITNTENLPPPVGDAQTMTIGSDGKRYFGTRDDPDNKVYVQNTFSSTPYVLFDTGSSDDIQSVRVSSDNTVFIVVNNRVKKWIVSVSLLQSIDSGGSFGAIRDIYIDSKDVIYGIPEDGANILIWTHAGTTYGMPTPFIPGAGGGGSILASGVSPGNGANGFIQILTPGNFTFSPSQPVTIPLEFFFCRRHSHNNKSRERLRKPYFPLCAMWNQRLYVRFTFNPSTWWCSQSGVDIYPTGTTQWPRIITEEILLEDAEKLYYQNTPVKYIVNKVQKESPLFYSSGSPILQLTANFPVQMITWFFRNKNYENVNDARYYNLRYNYGYTTQYISTGINLSFPYGTSNYVDVIKTAKIVLNNVDISSTFNGSLYYTFKQPMEHGISIPSKNIYTYSFGLNPKEYNQGGYLNFSKLNSQTTTLQLVFLPSYQNQITSGYNLYLFYYGYAFLQFQGGFASLLTL
jgi:hypothetical protein